MPPSLQIITPKLPLYFPIPLGLLGTASITQFLGFSGTSVGSFRAIGSGTAVTVKFKIPVSLLGLIQGIEIGTFSGGITVGKNISGPLSYLGTGSGNAAGYDAMVKVPIYTGTSLLNVLNGAGEVELILKPSVIYNGIYLKLSGNALSISLTSELFHAYILEEQPLNCTTSNNVIDVLSGVKGNALVNLISATGSVASPWNAADVDPAMSTFSTISTGVQILSNVFETVVFETASMPGDSVKIVLQDPGAGLLDLAALNGFVIQPYLGNVPVGTPITSSSSLLTLELLTGASNKYELTSAIPVSFDRIEISLGGVVDALSQIRIYDVQRVMSAPVISNSTNSTSDTVYVSYGNSVDLTAAHESSADSIKWYNEDNQWLANGNTYHIANVTQEGWYYAQSSRFGCARMASTDSIYVKIIATKMLALAEREPRNKVIRETIPMISVQNPVDTHMSIRLWGFKGENLVIELITSDGQILNARYVSIHSDNHKEEIVRSYNVAPGLYIVTIINPAKSQRHTFKIVFK